MPDINWQQSSHCESGSACISLATTPSGGICFRESDAPETMLKLSPSRLRPLISRIKANRLDWRTPANPSMAGTTGTATVR
ncbi:DUF397 domain-containing protein [Streptomyces sp. NPDC002537]